MADVVLGIFVGGKAVRMGGQPKGLLRLPSSNETIVERLARLGQEAGLEAVLVGEADAYKGVARNVQRLPDAVAGLGPLGGLLALLRHAAARPAIAIGCDMPFVTTDALRLLIDHPAQAIVVAPRGARGWEPLFARYDSTMVLPVLESALADKVDSFQMLFSRLAVEPIDVDPALFSDWDTPADVVRSRSPT